MSSRDGKLAGARKLLQVCGQAREGEEVLVVCDPHTRGLAEIIAEAGAELGVVPLILQMPIRARDGQEPPDSVAAAMAKANLILTPVQRSITHTHAVRNAVGGGSRALVLTQWTEDFLVEGGINADFPAIQPTCLALGRAFEAADRVRVTAPGGTDLTFDCQGRPGNALTCIVGPGEFSPVPTIEANVSPIEGTAEGVVVADVSIPYVDIGVLEEPVRAVIEGGMVVRIEGGRQARELDEVLRSFEDPMCFNVAELGIGMNPAASVTGFMLEDEAVARTAHLGIGTSITLGGTVKAASHFDLLFWHPTVELDGKVAVKDGEVVV
jgi:2,5-dihydroxypyridine 5,6-dioxygenase